MGLDELIKDPEKTKSKRKFDDMPKKSAVGKKFNKKGETLVYAPKKKKEPESAPVEKHEKMTGTPSLSFIRKIYNILNHK